MLQLSVSGGQGTHALRAAAEKSSSKGSPDWCVSSVTRMNGESSLKLSSLCSSGVGLCTDMLQYYPTRPLVLFFLAWPPMAWSTCSAVHPSSSQNARSLAKFGWFVLLCEKKRVDAAQHRSSSAVT